MKKVLVAGASGVLGREIVKLLHDSSYWVKGLVRNPAKQAQVAPYCQEVVIANALQPAELSGSCDGVDIVLSTIGKSVSLFTPERHSFLEIDFRANLHLLEEARRAGVSRFVYVGIFGSETSPRLRQGWAQEMFSQNLLHTPLSRTVIKPVGLFSGLNDLIIMGKRGWVMTPGNGHPKTNAIHPRDLARVCVDHLEEGPEVLNVGGPEVHTRNEIAQMVCRATACGAALNIPLWLVKPGLGVVRVLNQNLYDKLSYFTYITTHDMVAPRFGSLTFDQYLKEQGLSPA